VIVAASAPLSHQAPRRAATVFARIVRWSRPSHDERSRILVTVGSGLDVFRREVDFLIVRNRKPWFLVEAKLGDTRLSPLLA
jgi:hypothetical protein